MIDMQSRHPSYPGGAVKWRITRTCFDGELAVKAATTEFLPATEGETADNMAPQQRGSKRYRARLARTPFPDLVAPAVRAGVGLIHRKSPMIDVPPELGRVLDRLSISGETFAALHRRVTLELLVVGRIALLIDPVEDADAPGIAFYSAESLMNWDEALGPDGRRRLAFAVLDESHQERRGFRWETVDQQRVLELSPDGVYQAFTIRSRAAGVPQESDPVRLAFQGREREEITLVVANACGLGLEPESPPLLGLSQLAITIYRGESDLRQSLHMSGQDVLVLVGASQALGEPGSDVRVGAGSCLSLPQDARAEYVGPRSVGLSEQREVLAADYARAASMGATFLAPRGRAAESGEALSMRMAAETATLTSVARSSAAALEQALRHVAVWMGLPPEKVKVEANMDFVTDQLAAQELVRLVEARQKGAPLSLESLHELLRRGELTGKTLAEELAALAAEPALGANGGNES